MATPVTQGTLNRLRNSVVVPLTPYLNVTSSYMGKSQARLSPLEPVGVLIDTATGGVSSPEPYAKVTLTINLLRTQSLSGQWLAQVQLNVSLGPVTTYSDSAAFPEITLQNCTITSIDPGAYDGTDPVVRVTVQGYVQVNLALWAAA